VEPPYEEFDNSLQWRRENIGEYNGDLFDSLETNLYVSTSNCEELKEDNFQEEYYAPNEFGSLKEYWWPKECLHNVELIFLKTHLKKGERKRKRENVNVILGGRSAGEGVLATPLL
jgi:hypothetical protein